MNPGRRGTTRVSGPGQNRAASSAAATSSSPATWATCSGPATSTGSGTSSGRPLRANSSATASGWVGSAARPYTVSVGTATTVSYTHLRAHETVLDLVCRLL